MKNTNGINFGLFYVPVFDPQFSEHAQDYYQGILKQVELAEQLGWRNVWLSEHHGHSYGGIINAPEILGAYLAAHTKDIRIGPAICILPFHSPRQLTDRYAMLDQLSGGRLDMGVGRGFLPNEYELFGVDMSESKPKATETLKLVKEIWTSNKTTFQGKYYNYEEVSSYPRPFQQPHPPIWLAASKSQSSFELAGKLGYNLMINPYTRTDEEVSQGLSWYKNAAAEAGHNPDQLRIAAIQHLVIGEPDKQVADALDHYITSLAKAAVISADTHENTWHSHFEKIKFDNVYPEKVMFGTPKEVSTQIDKWIAKGVTDFCFQIQFGNLPWEIGLKTLKKFNSEVIPLISKDC